MEYKINIKLKNLITDIKEKIYKLSVKGALKNTIKIWQYILK